MVKLKGPGLAQKASGSIGKAVTFSTWKGRPYMKTHAEPAQPNTLPQQSMKLMMAFLAMEWQNLSADDAATWDDVAEPKRVSRFNAFEGVNLARWRNFLAPGMRYPVTETGDIPVIGSWPLVCSGNKATPRVRSFAPGDAWGLIFYQVPLFDSPTTWHDAFAIQHFCGFCFNDVDFYPDETKRYCFRWQTFTTDGKWHQADPKHQGCCDLTA